MRINYQQDIDFLTVTNATLVKDATDARISGGLAVTAKHEPTKAQHNHSSGANNPSYRLNPEKLRQEFTGGQPSLKINMRMQQVPPPTGSTSFTPLDTIHANIQHIWGQFGSMNDQQRNVLLKGLLKQCESKQVDAICTGLNLRQANAVATSPSATVFANIFRTDIKALGNPVNNQSPSVNRNSPKLNRAHLPKLHHPPQPSKKAQQEAVESLSPNLLIKLLNNSENWTENLFHQVSNSGPQSSQIVIDFLSKRTQNMQKIMTCMSKMMLKPDSEKTLKELQYCGLDVMGVKNFTMYIWDCNVDMFVVRSSNWKALGLEIPTTSILCSALLLEGDIANINNAKALDEFTQDHEKMYEDIELDCLLSYPILDDNHTCVAILEVTGKTSGPPYYSHEDEFLIKQVGHVAEMMLFNQNLLPKKITMARHPSLDAVIATASLLNANQDLHERSAIIMNAAKEICCAERCALFIFDKEKQELWSSVAPGAPEIRFPVRKGIAGHVALEGEVLNVPDAYADSRFNRDIDASTGYKTRNILCIPLRNSEGTIIGVTQVINKLPVGNAFTVVDIEQMIVFSGLVSSSVSNALIIKNLREEVSMLVATKDYYQQYLKYTSSVIMVFNKQRHLEYMNRPDTLQMAHDYDNFTKTPYSSWLTEGNQQLVIDLDRIYKYKDFVYVKSADLVIDANRAFQVDYSISAILDRNGEVQGVILQIERIKNEIKNIGILTRYMHPETVKLAMTDSLTVLDGQREDVVVMYIKLHGFHANTKNVPPNDAIYALNSQMVNFQESILAEEGVMLKFLDAGVFAVFGLPFAKRSDPLRAISSAIKALEPIDAVNRRNRAFNANIGPMSVGISCTRRTTLSGLFGKKGFQDYSLTGDCFEITAVIQAKTKLFGGNIIIVDEDIYLLVLHTVKGRKLDKIKIHDNVITLYQVLGFRDAVNDPDTEGSLAAFDAGMAEYESMQFSAAMNYFKKSNALAGNVPAMVYEERCRRVVEGKVSVGKETECWDGVFPVQ